MERQAGIATLNDRIAPALRFLRTAAAVAVMMSWTWALAQDVTPVVVENPETPRWTDGLSLRLDFTEELSIGLREGDENYLFGRRIYFNADGDGNVYVTDWDRKHIRTFDPQGRYLRTIGRAGQGPGEFGNLWGPEFDGEGNLYVQDISNRRITFFSRDGACLRSMPIPQGLGVTRILSPGRYLTSLGSPIEGDAGGSSGFVTTWGLFDGDFKPLVEWGTTTQVFKPLEGRGEDALARWLADLCGTPFAPVFTAAAAADGMIHAGCPDPRYEIRTYSPDGRLVRVVRRAGPAVPVTERHREDWLRVNEDENFRFLPYPAGVKRKARDLIVFPRTLPAYRTFAAMESGWLAVVVDTLPGDTIFDLFDQDGLYISRFRAPIPAESLIFKNGRAYALSIDEDGYRSVKRYRFEIVEEKRR